MFDFVRYTDVEGKMPILKPLEVPLAGPVCKSHKYWTEYRNNAPVKCRPYPGQTEVWDYKQQTYIPLPHHRSDGGAVKI